MSKIFDTHPILVDVPVPIKTDRLILRPPQAGDGKMLNAAKKDSLSELKEWMPWAHQPLDEKTDEIMCRQNYAKFLTREDLMLLALDSDTGDMIGATGLHRMNWELRIFEIGYWIRTSKTGNGYATELTAALIKYAFKALSASRVYICHGEGNKGSQKVIEKLGFIKEGVRQSCEWKNIQHPSLRTI